MDESEAGGHANEPVIEVRDRNGRVHRSLLYYVPQMVARGMEVVDPVAYALARHAWRGEVVDQTPVGPDDSATPGPPVLPIPEVPTAGDREKGGEVSAAVAAALGRPVMRFGREIDDGNLRTRKLSARTIPIRVVRGRGRH